ncbi:hypothetical protein KAX08_03970, partial [candidate division WOR-3 bacterium]|nr:hypothetical protein [candidate division WOR-3 bacterium]
FLNDVSRKEQLKWWVNRDNELEEWRKIISQSENIDKNYISFIIASYGRGKTLSLLKIIDEANKHKKIYPIYLNFKSEEKSKPGIDFIFRIFRNIDFKNVVEGKNDDEVREAITAIPAYFEEPKQVLRKIYFGKPFTGLEKHLFKDSEKGIRGKRSDTSRLAQFFLQGERTPTTRELGDLGVIRKIENVDIAKEYLAATLCFLRNLNFKSFLFAVDEFEYLFGGLVSRSHHSIYIALLRSLYDFPIGIRVESSKIVNMVFFIAVSEDGWSRLIEMEKKERSTGGPIVPLLERVDSRTILGVFDTNWTRELIIKRLKYNRMEGKFANKPLIPFTQDFVDLIFKKTGGEQRDIIAMCGAVLDSGLAKRVSVLDKEFAEKAIVEEERRY